MGEGLALPPALTIPILHAELNIESFRLYCIEKPGVTEETPFGPDALVYKVSGKMFALLNLARLPLSAGLKADPERSADWREQYDDVTPGYHMNKKHWNTVILTGDVPESLMREMIDHSYELVRAGLPKKMRETLA